MLNYLRVFCQLKRVEKFKFFILLLTVVSCSGVKKAPELAAPIPLWLDAPHTFRMSEKKASEFHLSSLEDDLPPVHLFFDHLPFVDFNKNMLNVVIQTPAGSPVEYAFNLLSGRFYTRRAYCKQKDVWRSYRNTINRPPFTTAFVPRLLNARGTPQKVFVFGSESFYKKNFSVKHGQQYQQSSRVRVVGGRILQFCDLYPCKKHQWKSEIVLFAVPNGDSKFDDVKNLKDLALLTSWREVKAFIENGEGRSFDGAKLTRGKPAYRLLSGSDAEKSLRFAFKYGKHFVFKNMKKMRASCYDLYEYVWKSSLLVRQESITVVLKYEHEQVKHKVKQQKLNASRGAFFENNLAQMEIALAELQKKINLNNSKKKKKKKTINPATLFKNFLQDFSANFGEEFYLCSKYVRSASINSNPKRAVFMEYLIAFFQLDRMGHNFKCSTRSWLIRHKYLFEETIEKTIYDRLQNCSDSDLDSVFRTMTNYLNSLRRGDHRYIHFIDYDNGALGTHHKLYSWVVDSGKKLRCEKDSNQIKVDAKVGFPTDFLWDNFALPVGINTEVNDDYIR